jgi:hypothetical protein
MDKTSITDLIQELLAVPAARWKKEIIHFENHTSQDHHYLESYDLEYKEYLITLNGHYGGVNSGSVELKLFGRNNDRGKKLYEDRTIRKDISQRARQIPTALAELYARIQHNYNLQ